MTRLKTLFIAALAATIALSSCTNTHHTGYNKNIYKKKNGCMLSDEGCAWPNKARK